MSEKQETIADIVADMRGLVKPGETLNNTYELLNGLADRIEAARQREVGNGAKMREALEDSNGLLEELAAIGEWGESARGQIAENNAALAEPRRNCDRFNTLEDALAGWREVSPDESGPFDSWLFAEAKGEPK